MVQIRCDTGGVNEVAKRNLVKEVTLLWLVVSVHDYPLLRSLIRTLRLTVLHNKLRGVPIWPAAPMRVILVILEDGLLLRMSPISFLVSIVKILCGQSDNRYQRHLGTQRLAECGEFKAGGGVLASLVLHNIAPRTALRRFDRAAETLAALLHPLSQDTFGDSAKSRHEKILRQLLHEAIFA